MKNLSTRELQHLIQTSRQQGKKVLAYLPVGCTEQHGPFLPIEADSLIAEHISYAVRDKLAEKYGGYVFPSICYTPSQSNAHYCGTASITDNSFRIYANEVYSSIMNSEFDALIVMAGHAGAEPSLREIGFWFVNRQYSSGQTKIRPVLVVSIFEVAQLIEKQFGQKPGRHADWREFLLLYHILGREYFTDKKMEELKDFHKSNSFEVVISQIYGVPMEYRSTEGVLGEPLPTFSSDLEQISSKLWEFLIENLSSKTIYEIDNFCGRKIVT